MCTGDQNSSVEKDESFLRTFDLAGNDMMTPLTNQQIYADQADQGLIGLRYEI